jgi:NADPH2:quinone reductase
VGRRARRRGDRHRSRTDEKAELARANGCRHVVVYTREDFAARVLEITDGKKAPVVYDGTGRDTFMKSLDCLRRARSW